MTTPQPIHWPTYVPEALADLHAQDLRLRNEHRTLVQARLSAQKELDRADDLDRQAIATARMRNEPVPDTTVRSRCEADLTRLRTLEAGLGQALSQTRYALEQAVTRARPEWEADLIRQQADAEAAYEEAVRTLAAAREQVRQVRGARQFVARFPLKTQAGIPNPPVAFPRRAVEVPFVEVVDALLADATVTVRQEERTEPDPSGLTATRDGVLYLGGAA